jgi:hypothetical protein
LTPFNLYREPTLLDTAKHRNLKLASVDDHSMAEGMHSCFIAATEIGQAAREFAIVFVRDGDANGKPRVRPMAVLGLSAGENLYLDGIGWGAGYVPAYIRRYPFWAAQLEGMDQPALLFDAWWHGFSETQGDPLYDDEGQPTPRLLEAIRFVEGFDLEAQRTDVFCEMLVDLDVLREMSATVSLADGSKFSLDGLFAVDEARLNALDDEIVLKLHRGGALALIHAHRVSLSNLQTLVDRKAKRMQPAAAR